MFGLKKVVKADPIEESILRVPPPLQNAVFLFGKTGAGKTTAMLSMAQKYHDHPERRYKIIDLWGGNRYENLFWALPSRDQSYWAKVKKKLKLSEPGPKQYRVKILYPMSKNLPAKLPNNPPHVISKIFTIPIKGITVGDISLAIDNVSQSGMYFWREGVEQMKSKDNGAVLDKKFKELNGTKAAIYRNFTLPLVRHRLLSSENYGYNLDMIEELKDRDTITVFSFEFLEPEFHSFVVGYILRQISELITKGRVGRKNLIMMREVGEFFRASDSSAMPERCKLFKGQLANHIRLGRKGMHFFLDTQSPREAKGLVAGSEDFTILGKLPSEADRTEATYQLQRDNLISAKKVQALATLNPGEYFFVGNGKDAKRRYLFLPRTMYWKASYGNFYNNVWKNLVDKWVNTKDDTDAIELDFQAARKVIAEQEMIEKALAEEDEDEEKPKKKGKRTQKVMIDDSEIESSPEIEDEPELLDESDGDVEPEAPMIQVTPETKAEGLEIDLW